MWRRRAMLKAKPGHRAGGGGGGRIKTKEVWFCD